ncbi:hypothetical protein ZIOFF_055466 [Zingiber officinale]|uniref:Rad51-like C-terminal domain-containing protein n=1 Tax=Zingiber officinale TaxID=94328 RepID=A0A8J5FGH4_ZINOF|nr:hypothetical protein ZIOFF_055466 [Zingiber officinale]
MFSKRLLRLSSLAFGFHSGKAKMIEEHGQLLLVDQEDEDEEEIFESIYKLILQGINEGDIKKLQDSGIYTCNGLTMHTKKNLTGIKGLFETKVDKIYEAAEKLVNIGHVTGSDLLLRRKAVIRITMRSQALDELLGDAIGAHALRINAATDPHARRQWEDRIYRHRGNFSSRSDRADCREVWDGCWGLLDNIVCARVYTYEYQYNLLLGLVAKMFEESFRLLIVDSVIALFRVDCSGRGELAEC